VAELVVDLPGWPDSVRAVHFRDDRPVETAAGAQDLVEHDKLAARELASLRAEARN
jgi:hypothetical protein